MVEAAHTMSDRQSLGELLATKEFSVECARHGHLRLLKWAKSQGCIITNALCTAAAQGGHMDVLKWLRAKEHSWERTTSEAAAKNGHLHVLKWGLAKRCRWSHRAAAAAAARAGHLPILEWMHSKTTSLRDDWEIFYPAAKGGHLHVLEWARANGFSRDGDNKEVSLAAASKGHGHVVKWLHKNGYPLSSRIGSRAALLGNLELLQWAYQIGNFVPSNYIVPRDYCAVSLWDRVAERGHLDILKYAHTNGLMDLTSRQVDVCSGAAFHGHVPIIEWLESNKLPLNIKACAKGAAAGGQLHILQWARQKGCQWEAAIFSFAAGSGHMPTLQWLKDTGCPWDKDACAYAATSGHLVALQWLKANGCPWDARACWRKSWRESTI